MVETPHYDILVIGGGINGAGIARDAAGRGYSVCLAEAGDFGGGTSSASTKLIHGGLRYLEFYEFRLVREALMEREILWGMAPHIIRPLRFVLPYHSGLRPAWLLRIGLFLYDNLGGRKLLPGTKTLDLTKDTAGKPLKPGYRKGFEYSDCWVEDARLVVLNLRDAQAKGATVLARTTVTSARLVDSTWHVSLHDRDADATSEITASLVVNAAGPWVDNVLKSVFGQNDAQNVRLVRGSHIVIDRKFDHGRPYIFQNADGRILFAIPYETDYTLIGTTDAEQEALEERPAITPQETEYLCKMASEYFAEPVTTDDVVWTYSGVRPLYDDGASKAQEATRDYVIRPDKTLGNGRLVNIFGGKITTYRRLAESMLAEVEAVLGKRGPAWTKGATLPGGDFPTTGFDDLVRAIRTEYPLLDAALVRRLARLYGTDARTVVDGAKTSEDLGRDFGHGLTEAEVRYLMKTEWARAAEDILFRRTKLGIRMSEAQKQALADWMAESRGSA
ncbi:glycerol-3-phosphate dehydrogenase [Oricola sp.]|uniref:glycerol-3-phosphate dehydrogenase n=1 Tax=Oricola sp. TaxID=1979950 RepID=UPI000C97C9ED|nr:glycerol-3-phosphate dehydrogenase [Ahrensia sp.]|tara:strand:- start:59488 stop:60999 length:1512 start_codon:yes stop_codon:yes gene_type:complete